MRSSATTLHDARWNDWKWQFRNRITRVDQLAKAIYLSEQDKQDISFCLNTFRMAVTPYYASLMDPADPRCPIRMQAVPTVAETRVLPCDLADPLNEEGDSPVPGIVHRYPDRVLMLITRQCATYCRHCTRRRMVGEEDHVITETALQAGIRYIRETPAVRDVLLSGGDPLTLSDGMLEHILSELRKIDHVEIIRIGTRVPVVMPMRITPDLTRMLRKYHPIWINTHFNHPRELTPASRQACEALVDAGIPLGNQSVLLRGINDDAAVMKELLLGLVKSRVRPYYLYQCDMSQGIGHFRTRVETGVEIMRSLIGNISGFAIPRFVIDAPGGGGKIPINPEYVVSMDEDEVVMRNFRNRIYTYPQHRES